MREHTKEINIKNGCWHMHTHTCKQMHIDNRTMKSTARSISHTLIPPPASRCVFKHHKGDYTGAKILRDQLINAIFRTRISTSGD